MIDQSRMFRRMTSSALRNAISSQEGACGVSLPDLQDGQTSDLLAAEVIGAFLDVEAS